MRVLINSLPKSGTHLLAKAVELCGFREHFDGQAMDDPMRVTPLFLNYREVKTAMAQQPSARQQVATISVGTLTPALVDTVTFGEWLAAMPQRTYLLGHLGWTPNLAPLLAQHDVRHVFIIRDPRAVIVSLLSFILDTKGMPKPHFLEADFQAMSPTQRLDLLLKGGFAPLAKVQVTGFANIFHSMFAWQQEADCLLVKFEDLVGEQGGGSVQQQEQAIQRIAAYLGKALDEPLQATIQQIYNPNARTFRKGSIHGWQQSLDAATRERINTYCQPLCAAAGYVS